MRAAKFGIVGGGWRAEFFARLGALRPDELELAGVAVQRPEHAEALRHSWGVPAYLTPAELIRSASPDFVVTSLPWDVNSGVVRQLVAASVRVLSETPPAPDADGLRELWSQPGAPELVQVAEQYPLMPGHAARKAIIDSGVIGRPAQVQVSSTHTYHAIALMRHLLGTGFRPARVHSVSTSAPLVDPLSRAGWTGDPDPKPAENLMAVIDFGDGQSGFYDFTSNQWHNQLRHRRITIRGSHGEIADDEVVHLAGPQTILHSPLIRQHLGHDLNLDGFDTELFAFEGKVMWRNPFLGDRLMDEEIAISELLRRTARWAVDDAAGPYPLTEACQDHLLGLAIDESLLRGTQIQTQAEPWAAG